MVLLALHPEVQQKLYEELVAVWPNGTPTSSAVSVSSTNYFLVFPSPLTVDEYKSYKEDFPKLVGEPFRIACCIK